MSAADEDTSGAREAAETRPEAAPSPLERGYFRETAEGTPVFFPWGLGSRGYVLDAAAARRARRAVSVLYGAVLGVATWAAYALESRMQDGMPSAGEAAGALGWPLAALAAVVGAYALWASRLAERFPESDLQVPREQRLREAAQLAEPSKVALAGLGLAAMGLAVAWLDPEAFWIGALGAAAGAGLVLWAGVLRRAASAADRADGPGPPSGGASGTLPP